LQNGLQIRHRVVTGVWQQLGVDQLRLAQLGGIMLLCNRLAGQGGAAQTAGGVHHALRCLEVGPSRRRRALGQQTGQVERATATRLGLLARLASYSPAASVIIDINPFCACCRG
jgi:hypothetical protein